MDNYMYGEAVFDDTVTVPQNEYNELLEDSKFLAALRAAGVDNWDGWDFALDILDTFK